jgi:hypothetical protein
MHTLHPVHLPTAYLIHAHRYTAVLVDVGKCDERKCVFALAFVALRNFNHGSSGNPETASGPARERRKQMSNPVDFEIALRRRPGWSLKIRAGTFSASALSVNSDGSMTAVTTSCDARLYSPHLFYGRLYFVVNGDASRLNDRRDLPILVKATYNSWPYSAANFLADTSYDSRISILLFILGACSSVTVLQKPALLLRRHTA